MKLLNWLMLSAVQRSPLTSQDASAVKSTAPKRAATPTPG